MKLYLLSRPSFEAAQFARFLEDEGLPANAGVFVDPAPPAELLCEQAGRVCYMSYGKGRKTTEAFLAHIIESGHHSVLEHANWSILITGVSRSLTHELVRHRHFSYSQLSQRYVDHSDLNFVVPEALEEAGLGGRFMSLVQDLEDFYRYASESLEEVEGGAGTARRKAIKTAARAILPNATETKIVVTGNARAWREFISKRATPYADPEIRALAFQILGLLSVEAPSMFSDLKEALV